MYFPPVDQSIHPWWYDDRSPTTKTSFLLCHVYLFTAPFIKRAWIPLSCLWTGNGPRSLLPFQVCPYCLTTGPSALPAFWSRMAGRDTARWVRSPNQSLFLGPAWPRTCAPQECSVLRLFWSFPCKAADTEQGARDMGDGGFSPHPPFWHHSPHFLTLTGCHGNKFLKVHDDLSGEGGPVVPWGIHRAPQNQAAQSPYPLLVHTPHI